MSREYEAATVKNTAALSVGDARQTLRSIVALYRGDERIRAGMRQARQADSGRPPVIIDLWRGLFPGSDPNAVDLLVCAVMGAKDVGEAQQDSVDEIADRMLEVGLYAIELVERTGGSL
ncbi:hypothetical protein [Pseudoclavibacter soli]|uniref:hypothetical protein n=1 Tax=Pseudoclavibacter soli TaxID=452623 RepID=UPI0003F6146F|nr:hypothetical protein [Pseudoclavibacter soli]